MRAQGLQGEHGVGFLQFGNHLLQDPGGGLHGVFAAHAREQAALHGRAEHQDPAAQVGAQAHELAEIVGRTAADLGVGMRQVEAFGLGQQPMQADDFQAVLIGQAPQLGPLLGRHIAGVFGQREGRNLDAGIAALGGEGKGLLMRPILKRLVADGELHGDPQRVVLNPRALLVA